MLMLMFHPCFILHHRATRGNLVSVPGCEGAGGAAGGEEESSVISKMSKPPTRDNGSEASSSLVVVRPPTCALLFKGANYVGGAAAAESRSLTLSKRVSPAPCPMFASSAVCHRTIKHFQSFVNFDLCLLRGAPPSPSRTYSLSKDFWCPGMSYFFDLRQ